jgi:SAM-dependent methyltransferase
MSTMSGNEAFGGLSHGRGRVDVCPFASCAGVTALVLTAKVRRILVAAGLVAACAWSSVSSEGLTARPQARTPDVFFAGTPPRVVSAMLRLAQITPDDVVYDLGSGDGRIVIQAAREYGARGVGIELEPPLIEIARHMAREAGVADRVAFIEGDFFTADISEATVVMLFLSSAVNARLESKLRAELRPGTRVVSHQFPIGTWAPDAAIRPEPGGTDLFRWTIRPR